MPVHEWKVIISSCRAARPDPHNSMYTIVWDTIWHCLGYVDLMKMTFCDALDHRHAFHSTPIVKYTENGPLPHSSMVDVNMFGKESDTMRMFISEDQRRPDLEITGFHPNFTSRWHSVVDGIWISNMVQMNKLCLCVRMVRKKIPTPQGIKYIPTFRKCHQLAAK